MSKDKKTEMPASMKALTQRVKAKQAEVTDLVGQLQRAADPDAQAVLTWKIDQLEKDIADCFKRWRRLFGFRFSE